MDKSNVAANSFNSDKAASSTVLSPCDRVIFWLIFLLFLLYPICVNPFFAPTFNMPKLTLLRILSTIIIIAWFIKILSEERISLVRSSLYLPLVSLILVNILATLRSVHLLTALFGEYGRWEGLLTLLCYSLLTLAALTFVQGKKDHELLLIALLISASLVSIASVIEHFGFNIFILGSRTYCAAGYGEPNLFEVDRSFATFGNPIYLGMFLAMVFPIATTWFLRQSYSKYPKTLAFLLPISLLLMSPALFFTFARGAWLGTGLACTVSIILGYKSALKHKIFIAAFLVVLLLGYLLTLLPSKNITYGVAQRAASTFKLEGSNIPRMEMWKATLPLILDYAVLGSGPDTFKLVFPKYKPAGWVTTFKNPQVDRAHNEILQVGATTGFLGGIVFIWLVATAFFAGFRHYFKIKDDREKTIILSLIVGAFSFITQVQFNPNSISVAPIFWVLLGLIFGSAAVFKKHPIISLRSPSLLHEETIKRIMYISVGILGLVLIIGSLRLYLADVYFSKALDAQHRKLSNEAEIYFEQANRLNAWEELYAYSFARLLADNALIGGFNDEVFSSSVILFDKSIQSNPLDENAYFFSGNAFLRAGRLTRKNEYFRRSIDLFRKGLKLNTTSSEAYLKMGVAYAYLDQNQKAIWFWGQAIQIEPANPYAYLNMGLIYEGEGSIKKAKRSYEKALKLDPQLKEAKQALERLKNDKN